MTPRVALVDSDGVLANFAQGLIDLYLERYGEAPIAVDGEPIKDESQWTHYRIDEQVIPSCAAILTNIMHEPGFFAALKPYKSSLLLPDLIREAGHQVDICTMPTTRDFSGVVTVDPVAIYDKLGWFVRHFPLDAKNVVLTKRKSHIFGSVLVDDCVDNINAWCNHHPHGLGILFDRPWNRGLKLEYVNSIRLGSYAEAGAAAVRYMNSQTRHPA